MTRWYQRRQDGSGARGRLGCQAYLIAGFLLAFLLAASHRLWLPLAARALIVDQPPEPADAILVLGGGDGSRCLRALQLYSVGWAPVIITTGEAPHIPGESRTRAEISADYLVEQGVPREAILLINEATSTRDEATMSLQLAQERGYRTLLVVTDSVHTRRASLAFRHVYRKSGVRAVFVAAYPEWLDVRSWWTEERSVLVVLEEYVKLAFYLLKGYI